MCIHVVRAPLSPWRKTIGGRPRSLVSSNARLTSSRLNPGTPVSLPSTAGTMYKRVMALEDDGGEWPRPRRRGLRMIAIVVVVALAVPFVIGIVRLAQALL